MAKNNGKATVQKLYDEIIPIVKDIAIQKTDIHSIKDDIKEIKTDMRSKISIKAFASWLGVLTGIITIITTLLFLAAR